MFTANESSLKRAEAALAASGTPVKSFAKVEIRDLSNTGFDEGEQFEIIPGKRFSRTVNGNTAYLTLVVTSTGAVKELYLSQLSRSVVVYEGAERAPESRQEEGRSKGTAVDLWKSCGNAEDGLTVLAGKTIKVTERRSVHTFIRPRGEAPYERDQTVYDFDLVPAAATTDDASSAAGAASAEA